MSNRAVGFLTEISAAARWDRDVIVLRKMRTYGVIVPVFLVIPESRQAMHYDITRVDELARWFKTEDILLDKANDGIVSPTSDGHLWILNKLTKQVEDYGCDGTHYTYAALAKKIGTSEWLLRKDVAKANKELLAEAINDAIDPSTVKLIGKQTYGQIKTLLSDADAVRLQSMKDTRESRQSQENDCEDGLRWTPFFGQKKAIP